LSIAFSFIHTADLHLDSPFKGLCRDNEELGNILKESTFKAFKNIVDQAIFKKVDFILIAGDIFENNIKSLAAQIYFFRELERLNEAGIRAYLAYGNHDPSINWNSAFKYPSLTTALNNEIESISIINNNNEIIATLHGLSFSKANVTENLVKNFPNKNDNLFNIGLLHCNVGSNTEHNLYAPCSIEDLKSKRYDYWALGHIHKHQILCETNPLSIYCGTPQGRTSKESGNHGCFYIQVDSFGNIKKEFIETDVVRWKKLSISIENIDNMNDLAKIIDSEINTLKIDNGNIIALLINLIITGRSTLYKELMNEEEVYNYVNEIISASADNPKVYIQKFEIKSRLPIDIDKLKANDDFIAYLINLIQAANTQEISSKLNEDLDTLLNNATLKKYFIDDLSADFNLPLNDIEDRCLELFCRNEI